MELDTVPHVCHRCRPDIGVGEADSSLYAKSCGHLVEQHFRERNLYCDFCAVERNVCMQCGNSIGRPSRPSQDVEDETAIPALLYLRLGTMFVLIGGVLLAAVFLRWC